MKKLSQLLSFKKPTQKKALDEKTIFFLFEKIIREEYGKQGTQNIKVSYYKKGKIFIKVESSNWASEIWLNKKNIIDKINRELGSKEILEISV